MPKFDLLIKKDTSLSWNDVKRDNQWHKYLFIVIDLELGDKYPDNFFALLPYFSLNNNSYKTCFFHKFNGDLEQAKKIAKQLLENLKAKTSNPEILEAINYRLKLLETPEWKKPRKCINCGLTFMPNRRKQKRCHECVVKIKTKQNEVMSL